MKQKDKYGGTQFEAYKENGFNNYKTTISSNALQIGNIVMYKPTGCLHAIWKIERTDINNEKWFNYESLIIDDFLLIKSGFEKDDFGLFYHSSMGNHHIKRVSTTYQLVQDAGLPIMGIYTFDKLQNVFKMITGIQLTLS